MTQATTITGLPDKLISDLQIVENTWHLLDESAGVDQLAELEGKPILVPLCCWQAEQSHLRTRQGLTGVWLASSEKASDLTLQQTLDINSIPMIALSFPIFTDGRNYSNARALRQNMGYQNDVMAIGDVLRDQVFYMTRCGINVLAPRPDQDLEAMRLAVLDFHDAYQASVTQPIPLFRRRQAE